MKMKMTFLMIGLIFVAVSANAGDSQRHQQVDGINIYLGVIPAQITQARHSEMHGGVDDKEHRYHILVALLDSNSGKRITDAKVKATVAQPGLSGETKTLEPMSGELLSYGNYFAMHRADNYQIRVEIQRGEGKEKSVARFVFDRPED
ncbi:hypothetical protein MNBD_GAMMA18-230 [hydrothermal vent metagenome]|uniref:DUF4426 domain-containing protein n=1 Tax=hydrothermal vent metagenome TaxID=652676 RepID=A0A3B0ZFL1_9ZZZZ